MQPHGTNEEQTSGPTADGLLSSATCPPSPTRRSSKAHVDYVYPETLTIDTRPIRKLHPGKVNDDVKASSTVFLPGCLNSLTGANNPYVMAAFADYILKGEKPELVIPVFFDGLDAINHMSERELDVYGVVQDYGLIAPDEIVASLSKRDRDYQQSEIQASLFRIQALAEGANRLGQQWVDQIAKPHLSEPLTKNSVMHVILQWRHFMSKTPVDASSLFAPEEIFATTPGSGKLQGAKKVHRQAIERVNTLLEHYRDVAQTVRSNLIEDTLFMRTLSKTVETRWKSFEKGVKDIEAYVQDDKSKINQIQDAIQSLLKLQNHNVVLKNFKTLPEEVLSKLKRFFSQVANFVGAHPKLDMDGETLPYWITEDEGKIKIVISEQAKDLAKAQMWRYTLEESVHMQAFLTALAVSGSPNLIVAYTQKINNQTSQAISRILQSCQKPSIHRSHFRMEWALSESLTSSNKPKKQKQLSNGREIALAQGQVNEMQPSSATQHPAEEQDSKYVDAGRHAAKEGLKGTVSEFRDKVDELFKCVEEGQYSDTDTEMLTCMLEGLQLNLAHVGDLAKGRMRQPLATNTRAGMKRKVTTGSTARQAKASTAAAPQSAYFSTSRTQTPSPKPGTITPSPAGSVDEVAFGGGSPPEFSGYSQHK